MPQAPTAEKQVGPLDAIHRLTGELESTGTPAEAFSAVLRGILDLTGALAGAAVTTDPRRVCRASAGLGEEGIRTLEDYEPWPAGGARPSVVLLPEPGDRFAVLGLSGVAEAHALAFVPMGGDGGPRGWFALWLGDAQAPAGLSLTGAQVMAAQLGAALRRIGLESAAGDERRLLAQYEITRALAESLTIKEVTPRILAAVCRILDWEVAALWAVDEQQDALTCAGTWREEGPASSAFLDETARLTFTRGLGLPGGVWESGMPAWVTDLAATDYPRAEVAGRENVHSGFAFPVRLAGKVLGVMEFFSSEMRSPDPDVLRDMEPVGSQIGQFIERKRAERALVVHRAILASHVEELERTRAELAFLLDASTALAGSLDYEQGIERLARVAASTLCDVCVVDVVQPDGSLRRAASLAADPAAQALADELRDRYPPSLAGPTPAAQAIRERRPVLSSSPTDATLRAASSCADHHSLLGRLGVVSYLAVPLIARGQALGAVTLAVTARSARSYGEEDLALAGQLARQAALILDNARLYEKERDLAQTLQRNLLPPELPAVPGLELAGRYVPASGRIGGDFYDVFPVGEGRWFMAIGDVCGKGPEAAALTSMVRHTLRGAAMHAGGSPSDVLGLVNKALLGQIPDSRFCTVACALLTPVARGARFVVSSAGHPLPLRRTADGRVAQVGHRGTLLGVFSDVQVEDDHRLLVPGESMAFFTDGALAEADPAALTAEPRLTSLLRREQGGAAAIATVLSQSALESNRRWSHRDDVTVLVASVARTTA